MGNMLSMAQMMLEQRLRTDPNFAKQMQQNPQAQEMINVLRSGDANRGIEMATNLHNSFGDTREEALNRAKQLFKIP